MRASLVEKGEWSEPQFVVEVAPEIRHLACERFGHPVFNMKTWGRLADWLIRKHGLKGSVPERDHAVQKTSRAEVIEWLRAEVEPATDLSSPRSVRNAGRTPNDLEPPTLPRTLDEHIVIIESYEADLAREKARLTEKHSDRLKALGAKFLGSDLPADQNWWDFLQVPAADHPKVLAIVGKTNKFLCAFSILHRPLIEPYDTPAKLASWIKDEMDYLILLACERRRMSGRSPYRSDPPEYAEDKSPNVYREARRRVLEFRKFVPDIGRLLPCQSDPIIGLQEIRDWCIGVSRAEPAEVADRAAISGRLVVSCRENEIRRDATLATEALAGLRQATQRMAIHGRSVRENQHVLSKHLGPAWRLLDGLKGRGMRFGDGATMELAGLPDRLSIEQQQDLRDVYLDLYSCLSRIEAVEVEEPGFFPEVTDADLKRFADVVARLLELVESHEPAELEEKPAATAQACHSDMRKHDEEASDSPAAARVKPVKTPKVPNTQVIPPEHRTRPMGKDEAGQLLFGPAKGSGPRRQLLNAIRAGAITVEELTAKSCVFDIRQFPSNLHPRVRPT